MPQGQKAPPTGSPPAYAGLSAREAEACELYLLTYNDGMAGRAMGLGRKNVALKFQRLRNQPHMVEALTARKQELIRVTGVYAEQIRDEARALAMSNIGNYLEEKTVPTLDENGKPKLDANSKPITHREVHVQSIEGMDMRAVAGIDIQNFPDGPPRIKLKMHEKWDPLLTIGKDAGAFQEDSKPLPNVTFNLIMPNRASGKPGPKVINPRPQLPRGPKSR
jgi:hypothetical protein